ncbi:unnamed protein product [Musa acuminata subsp. burmannicoides]
MATFLLLVLAVAMSSGSDAAWCVCRSDMSNTALQKALDYACGAGADCTPIIQNGACYNPNTVLAHCSYAANSYYQRKGQAQGACDFAGTASLTSTDPGGNGCTYPATSSVAGTSGTPTSTTPTSSTPAIGTPTSTSTTPPSTTTTPTTFSPPTTGATPMGTGGVLGGLGPTGTTSSIDGSDGGLFPGTDVASLLSTLLLSSLFLLRI